jgi:uncharacterized protein (DUF362 family)
MGRNVVSIVRIEKDIVSSVHKGITLIGGVDDARCKRVIVKPNLCHSSGPETGRTTDVRVVGAVLDEVLAAKPREICVVESDNYSSRADRAFVKLGYANLKKKPNIELVNLSTSESSPRPVQGKFFKSIQVPDILSNYGFLINIAKLKTHVFERFTGVYKNQYGLLPVRDRRPYHPFANEVFFDINTLYKPDLSVIDGIIGMEGCGPIDGIPKAMNLLIFGRNALATDSVACKLMGIDPFKVPHLKYASENGMEELDPSRIEVVGESVDELASEFKFIPERAYEYIRRGIRLGRYPSPLRNLGILLFTFGNLKAGEQNSTRKRRQQEDKVKVSAWRMLKKIFWTRTWNV